MSPHMNPAASSEPAIEKTDAGMNAVMKRLVQIFSDVLRENDAITFAYGVLEDRWYCLSLKYEDSYDLAQPVPSAEFALEKMLSECRYFWMKKHGFLHPALSLEECVSCLSPELSALLQDFLSPYERAARSLLSRP